MSQPISHARLAAHSPNATEYVKTLVKTCRRRIDNVMTTEDMLVEVGYTLCPIYNAYASLPPEVWPFRQTRTEVLSILLDAFQTLVDRRLIRPCPWELRNEPIEDIPATSFRYNDDIPFGDGGDFQALYVVVAKNDPGEVALLLHQECPEALAGIALSASRPLDDHATRRLDEEVPR